MKINRNKVTRQTLRYRAAHKWSAKKLSTHRISMPLFVICIFLLKLPGYYHCNLSIFAHFTTVIIIAHASRPYQSCCWAYQFRLRVLTDIVEPFHASSDVSYLLRIYNIKYRCTLNILLSLKLQYLCGLHIQTSTPTQHIYIYINIQYTIYSDRSMRKEK